jgi:ribosomal protein S18 acetylase RimI-like enzyme
MIRTATQADFATLTGVLVRAFADDPLILWLIRDDARRPEGYRRLFAEILRFGLRSGEVLTTNGSQGAAVWFAPGRYQMSLASLFALVPEVLRAFGPLSTLPKLMAVNQVGKRNPRQLHWYLFCFGVDPASQGQGVGGALLRNALEKIDAERAPAYLETALEKNVGLYQRFGFQTVDKLQVPRGGPPVWLMWREAR